MAGHKRSISDLDIRGHASADTGGDCHPFLPAVEDGFSRYYQIFQAKKF